MSGKERITQSLKVWFVVGPGLGFVAGLYLNYRQAAVAKKTYDRASGRVEAQLGEIKIFPEQAVLDAKHWISEGPFEGEVRFNDVDQVLAVNPVISVKNTGAEPIDALKVEVESLYGMIDAIGLPAELQRAKTPWVLKQSDVAEYVLNQKLRSSQTASVSILTGLLVLLR